MAYLSRGAGVFAIDLRAAEEGLDFNVPEEKYISSDYGYINALAFHPTEKVLYAIGQQGNGIQYLVKFLAIGTSEEINVGLLWMTTQIQAGEIDSYQQYWIAYNEGRNWMLIDLDASSPT